MARIVYVSGGARSGKSGYAQKRAEEHAGALLYVATAEVRDAEMAERVDRHRLARDARWRSLEEPLDLAGKIPPAAGGCEAILVDCLTLWLSNLLERTGDGLEITDEANRLIAALRQLDAAVYIVSNEVGSGIVPENRLARCFRDLAGLLNQQFAAAADEAWMVVSGLPLRLK